MTRLMIHMSESIIIRAKIKSMFIWTCVSVEEVVTITNQSNAVARRINSNNNHAKSVPKR